MTFFSPEFSLFFYFHRLQDIVDEVINLFIALLAGAIPFEDKNQEMEVMGMLDELKQLSAALSKR